MIKKMYIGFNVKYSLFLSGFKEMWIFSKSCEKYSTIKFNENLSSGNQVVPCVQKGQKRPS